ncbi:MAG: ArsA-related P-loop ATPase [Sandaracinus sp.]
MRASAPFERRLQLFTGKGGTGKTTLVAALGLAHAARGRRPLLLELGHRASLGDVLGAAIDHAEREVRPGLWATNLAPGAAVEAMVERALPSRVARSFLGARPVRTFVDAAPGVIEVATLDRLRALVADSDFDPILVDADATGHTQMLLALPDVLGSLGVEGPIAALLDEIMGVLASEKSAATHLAALPTHLAVEETLELWDGLVRTRRVALGHVVLGRVEGREAASLDLGALAARRASASGPAASALALLAVDARRWARVDEARRALRAHGIEARLVDEIEGALDEAALRRIGLSLLEEPAS